jgi:hypothetical protein
MLGSGMGGWMEFAQDSVCSRGFRWFLLRDRGKIYIFAMLSEMQELVCGIR